MTKEYELLVDAQAVIGEGPIWDEQIKKLYWVDIKGCQIHRYDPATGRDERLDTGKMVGAVAVRADGTLIAALHDGFYTVDFDAGVINPLWQTTREEGNRFNDGKCDPQGRFWAGTMSLDGKRDTGSLYRLDADHSVHHILSDIFISNGLAWTADQKTMYYIDSPRKEIWAFDYHAADGSIANRRTVVKSAAGEGVPDGMTIDIEGRLWVAQWGGSRVCCYDPRDGQKRREIFFPDEQTSSCIFGGANMDELYVTTAWNTLSDEARRRQPQAGSLYRVRPGTSGLAATRFLG